MKSIIIKTIVFILAGSLLSCNGFLDIEPLDRETSSNFYQTQEDAQMALVAIYDVLTYQSTPGVAWAPFITVSDMLSDDAYAGGSDANDGMEENQFNTHKISTSNPMVRSIWIKNYLGIYRANLYLEKIQEMDVTENFKTRTTAEAKFLRAYFYFEQVRFFENIPLITKTLGSPSEYEQEQNSPKEVYNQIALDLEEAAADLPEEIPASEAGRVSKWAAQALLARVYLFYNGVYGGNLEAGSKTIDKATLVAYLDNLIANSGHDLFADYQDNFKLEGEFGIESVFEISHGDAPTWWDWNYPRGGNGNLAAQMQGPRVTGSDNWDRGWSFAPVSYKLVQDIQDDPRYEYTVLEQDEIDGLLSKGYQHTGYFSRKYTSDAEHWSSGGQFELNRTCNYRVIRFSDVLLMAAELGSANAQAYLDRVRARVGLESVPASPENILRERRLELSLEGIRYFDLLRQGLSTAEAELTHSEIGPDYEGDDVLYKVNFDINTKGFLPIPQTELDLSAGAFRQNDGY